jgi:hypothetical protein
MRILNLLLTILLEQKIKSIKKHHFRGDFLGCFPTSRVLPAPLLLRQCVFKPE